MSIKTVALLGADGKLGPAMLDALLNNGFEVTVLKRASSKSSDSYPSGVQVTKVQDDFAVEAVVEHLRGQDAVVVTIKGSQVDTQYKLAAASAKAGVKRFIPADFGSCDSSSQRTKDLVPLYKRKTEVRDYLMQLAKDNPDFSWTSLVCGHFFDYNPEFLHLWPKERKADILDDGGTKWSASTLPRIAEATSRILLNLEATQDKAVFVQSFSVSQNQVVKSFERATGSSWKINWLDSKDYEKEEKQKADDGDLDAAENLVWILGAQEANWESKDGFAMRTLGLENEDLDTVVNKIVQDSK